MITIKDNEKDLAIIIPSEYSYEGIKFFTPNDYSQQLAYMGHKKGHKIQPHIHNAVHRNVRFTQEVLVIKFGKLKVNFYNDNQEYIESYILRAGDIILLASGGHGFEVLEDIEMVEIKQGPYAADNDKTRFEGINKK